MQGVAYRLTEAVPVDLFPHTPHYELIMKFERDTRKKKSDDVSAKEDTAKEAKTETKSNAGDTENEGRDSSNEKGMFFRRNLHVIHQEKIN